MSKDTEEEAEATQLTNDEAVKSVLTKKSAIMQVTMSLLANVTIISSGMGLGFPAITLNVLTDLSSPNALTTQQGSWFASITSIMCPFGGLLTGYLLDKIGRKMTLIIVNVISIIAWGIMTFSSGTNKDVMYIELMISRVIIGLAIGMSSSPASVYSAEICHPDLRGRLTLLTALCTGIGMLFVYLLGYFIPTNWRLVSGISGIFTIISLFVLLPVPESPSWLIGKERREAAEKSLRKVHGIKKAKPTPLHILGEINILTKNFRQSNTSKKSESSFSILKRPEVYKPLGIMITFFAFQQFSGIFVIIVYGAKFAIEAGVSINPMLCTVFIGITRVVTTLLMGFVSDKYGRKPPAIVSGIGMAVCMYALAGCVWNPTKGTSYDWLPGVLVIGFFFFATLGFLTLPFAMIAELFPQRFRGFGSGLTIFAGYTMSFVIIKLYPDMIEIMGNGILFMFYGTVSLVGIGFVYFVLPETKGKSLQEIEERFRGKHVEDVAEEDIELQGMATKL